MQVIDLSSTKVGSHLKCCFQLWVWVDVFPAPVLQPHRILQALKRYVRAENKDRLHTIRHYQHVLAVDPEKAAQMKSQVWRGFCQGSPGVVRGCGSCVLLGTTAASSLWSSPSLLCLLLLPDMLAAWFSLVPDSVLKIEVLFYTLLFTVTSWGV